MKQKYLLKSGSLKEPIRTRVSHPSVAARRFFSRALEGQDVEDKSPVHLSTRYEQVRNASSRLIRIQVVMYGHPALPRCLEVWEDKS